MAERQNRETFFPSTQQGQNLLQPLYVCLREAEIQGPCSVASRSSQLYDRFSKGSASQIF